jgi:nucleoside-diphosphate-sugar epimerase
MNTCVKPKTILITGATGLIGSHLLRTFGPEDTVYAFSRKGSVPIGPRTLPIDLGQSWSIEELPDGVDTIVHLAQSNHYRDFPLRTEDVFTVNLVSTVKLLDYARVTGVKQFVLASSGGVYGAGVNSFSEDEAITAKGELGFYIGTRLCSELLSECYSAFMNVVCLRFFFAYGPAQRPQMLVPRLVDSVRTGRVIKLRGESGLSINPVYVADAVSAVRRAMSLPGSHKVNVAGPEVISLRRMAEAIGATIGKTPVFEIEPAASSQDLIADIAKMTTLLGAPATRFEDGLRRYLAEVPDV